MDQGIVVPCSYESGVLELLDTSHAHQALKDTFAAGDLKILMLVRESVGTVIVAPILRQAIFFPDAPEKNMPFEG